MNNQQINAIATADVHLKNAELPTYTELLTLVRKAAAMTGYDEVEVQETAMRLVDRVPG